ncbi:hypothetical protein F4859DRAFT_511849 [Xylaria cf. heliscus]|nr:hypothetical protein F4859DRAFT_511849 [Xylaria cf. heliscus]
MCQIICNVAYACGHTELWLKPRACQFDARGNRKSGKKDPLCLIYGHCWEFGRVRFLNISDKSFQCTPCHIKQLEVKIKNGEARARAIEKARRNEARWSMEARLLIEEAERRSRLEDLPLGYIDKVTNVAMNRLDRAFSDAQMETYHFEELLQIMIGLPFLDKGRLVRKFARKAEQKFGPEEVRRFYELAVEYRNFGESFRRGLKKPDVLDKPVETAELVLPPVPTWVPGKRVLKPTKSVPKSL